LNGQDVAVRIRRTDEQVGCRNDDRLVDQTVLQADGPGKRGRTVRRLLLAVVIVAPFGRPFFRLRLARRWRAFDMIVVRPSGLARFQGTERTAAGCAQASLERYGVACLPEKRDARADPG
jgi:hypothetical protein